MVDKGAHSDSRASRHDVVESTALVDKVFITGNTWKSARYSQANAESLINNPMKIWVLLQLDPAQLLRILMLELLSKTCKLFRLRQQEERNGAQRRLGGIHQY